MFLVRNPGSSTFLLQDDYLDMSFTANSGAIDLEAFFSHDKLYYSAQPPSGALWLAIQNGDLIRRDNSNTIDIDAANAFYDPVWLYAPNEGQWEALVGSAGVPSSSNVYITELDFGVPSTITTLDATPTILYTLSVPNNAIMLINTRVVAIRTAGAAGSSGDAATFVKIATVKNLSGVITVAQVESAYTYRDQKTWSISFTVQGNSVNVEVTGALANTITWFGKTAGQLQMF